MRTPNDGHEQPETRSNAASSPYTSLKAAVNASLWNLFASAPTDFIRVPSTSKVTRTVFADITAVYETFAGHVVSRGAAVVPYRNTTFSEEGPRAHAQSGSGAISASLQEPRSCVACR